MFEATLSSTQPDRLRTQRLMLATLITVSMTAAGLASSWTLDRLGIDRVGGPKSDFELVEYSLVPPKRIDPPPPPDEIVDGGKGGPDSIIDRLVEHPTKPEAGITPPSNKIPEIGSSNGGGIPDGGGDKCRPPLCGLGTNSALTGSGDGTCVGPHCGVARKPAPPPAEVSFSSMHCLVCPDPDRAQLRRTASSMRKRGGSVTLGFCVNERGRVESDSIEIERSFGDVDVDRIIRAAVVDWRFQPMQVAGEPRRACSEKTFRITFD